jgi:hypothetical protein
VKLPRFRIAWLMVLVAIVGLDCWAIRTFLDDRRWIAGAGIGGLPMVHILIFVPLVSRSYRSSRRFLWGFEVFGAAAVILCIALMVLAPPFWGFCNQRLVINPLVRAWGVPMNWRDNQWLICGFLQSLLVTLPQLAFALICGFLVHHRRIS